MSKKAISQAEIDALVSSGPTRDSESGPDEISRLQEPLQGLAVDAGRALAELVGEPCQCRLGSLALTSVSQIQTALAERPLIARSRLTGGRSDADLIYLLSEDLAIRIMTQIYGGVVPSAMDAAAFAALSDGLDQMTQAGLPRLVSLVGQPLVAEPAEVLDAASLAEVLGSAAASVVSVTLSLTLVEETDQFLLLLPSVFARPLQMERVTTPSKGQPQAATSSHRPASMPAASTPRKTQVEAAVLATLGEAIPTDSCAPEARRPSPPATVRQEAAAAALPCASAAFPDLDSGSRRDGNRNIDLLMDVSLQVTVELGRTRRQIRDVLSLGPGSVVELDKLAGEQVDVLINGKLIARGEVVVIDENYGVRITDIKSPAERAQSFN